MNKERVNDPSRPFVRFYYEGTKDVVPVVETAETDDIYHLCQEGQVVDTQDGGKILIVGRSALNPMDIVFFCRKF